MIIKKIGSFDQQELSLKYNVKQWFPARGAWAPWGNRNCQEERLWFSFANLGKNIGYDLIETK